MSIARGATLMLPTPAVLRAPGRQATSAAPSAVAALLPQPSLPGYRAVNSVVVMSALAGSAACAVRLLAPARARRVGQWRRLRRCCSGALGVRTSLSELRPRSQAPQDDSPNATIERSSPVSGGQGATDVQEAACTGARGIGVIVERLYDNFNRCDVNGTAACFTHDVIYEDLLLGNSTIVESREDFRDVIQSHPAFLARRACEAMGIRPLEVAVCVDAISEDAERYSVGVEWHVEVDGEPLALGRGLSFMRVCPRTGLIQRAVDIAEAPWRAVGLLVAPFARGFRGLSRLIAGLFLPPILVSASGGLVLIGVMFVFLDRGSMASLREDIDTLDDFREGLETVSTKDIIEALAELSGVYPWDPVVKSRW